MGHVGHGSRKMTHFHLWVSAFDAIRSSRVWSGAMIRPLGAVSGALVRLNLLPFSDAGCQTFDALLKLAVLGRVDERVDAGV